MRGLLVVGLPLIVNCHSSPTWFDREDYGDFQSGLFENKINFDNIDPPITTAVDYRLKEKLLKNNKYDDLDELERIKNDWRLPRNSNGEKAHIPYHYDIHLTMSGLKEEDMIVEPLKKYFKFDGWVVITGQCNTQSSFIVLHAGVTYDFKVLSVQTSETLLDEEDWEHYSDKEYLIIHDQATCGNGDNEFELKI